MKIENLSKALLLADQLKQVERALVSIGKPLTRYTRDSENWSQASDESLYNMNLTEFGDGSGFKVDLTGCAVGMSVLKLTEQLLQAKRSDILTEIAGL
jgi:hypothetical protein